MELRDLIAILNPQNFPIFVTVVLLMDVSRSLRKLLAIEAVEAERFERIEKSLARLGGIA